jgi:hypothetical protein
MPGPETFGDPSGDDRLAGELRQLRRIEWRAERRVTEDDRLRRNTLLSP